MAGVAFPGVDLVKALESTFLALGIDIVAERAAAMADGAAEGCLDRTVERGDLGWRELVGGGEGVDAGGMKRFVDIDSAQAGDEALIEQGVLDGAGCFGQAVRQLPGAEGQWLRAQGAVLIRRSAQPEDAAKPAGVTKSQLLTGIGDRGDEMRMRQEGGFGWLDGQPAAHAQVNVKPLVAIELKNNPFGPALNAYDSSVCHRPSQIKSARPDDVPPKVQWHFKTATTQPRPQ